MIIQENGSSQGTVLTLLQRCVTQCGTTTYKLYVAQMWLRWCCHGANAHGGPSGLGRSCGVEGAWWLAHATVALTVRTPDCVYSSPVRAVLLLSRPGLPGRSWLLARKAEPDS